MCIASMPVYWLSELLVPDSYNGVQLGLKLLNLVVDLVLLYLPEGPISTDLQVWVYSRTTTVRIEFN